MRCAWSKRPNLMEYIRKKREYYSNDRKDGCKVASSVIGKLDSQVNKIFFEKGLSKSVDEAKRLEKMSPEEKEAYLKAKKEREDDIVLY